METRQKGPAPDRIQVALEDDKAFVRLIGRGSFKVSPAMKEFGTAAVARKIQFMLIDMRACVGMDSTFMGVLAGLAFKMRETGGGTIVVINLSSRTRGLLATLGLDQLITPYMEGATPGRLNRVFGGDKDMSELETDKASRQETAETMLKAHETLVELCPENLPKFKDVLTYLREDVKQGEFGQGSQDDSPTENAK
jgi:anti-anti-sigma regulatory factor